MKSSIGYYPTVSVILPAKNEAAYIRKCLESIKAFNYPRELLDVVVVDNGSTDATVSEALRYHVRVLEKRDVYVGAVRNAGVKVTRGELLVFIDADCIAGTNYIYSAVEALRSQEIGAVGGGCTAPADGTWVERAWGSGIPHSHEVKALAASTFAIRRDVFVNIGGFNEMITAGEDDELSNRLVASGYKLHSLKECWVIHLGYPKTLMAVAKRQVWHGSHQIQSAKNYLDRMLIITHLFLVGLMVLLVALVVDPYSVYSLVAAALLLMMTFILAFKKVRTVRGAENIVLRLCALVPVYFNFMVGRAIGLLKNYVYMIRR